MRLIVISGQSGSGKSAALHSLEDAGFYCMDNLPVGLLPLAVQQMVDQRTFPLVAIGVDVRSGPAELKAVPEILERVRARGVQAELVFLQADPAILIKRFSETRRKHPLSHGGLTLAEALEREQELLQPLARVAGLKVDTSRTNVHELRALIRGRLVARPGDGLSLLFQSFGFKHGLPLDTDYIFDLRCLPNPHWDPGLRPLTGRDPGVIRFLEDQPQVVEMLADIIAFLDRWIRCYEAENRSYLTVSLGCTGGFHRSVFMAERLGAHFARNRSGIAVRHRELL